MEKAAGRRQEEAVLERHEVGVLRRRVECGSGEGNGGGGGHGRVGAAAAV